MTCKMKCQTVLLQYNFFSFLYNQTAIVPIQNRVFCFANKIVFKVLLL